MTEKEAEKAYDAAPAVPLPAARVTAIVKAATVDDGRPKRALCSECGERERIQGLKKCGDCIDLGPVTTAPAPNMRRCLKCDVLFESAGPANRICAQCNRSNSNIAGRFGVGDQ